MTTNEKLADVLNGLIEINNDRVEGYKNAAQETDAIDVDLQAIFHKMAADSAKFAGELQSEVVRLGGDPADGTTNMGKVYRVWMDIKSAFTGKDRKAILSSCEYGEDAAQKAYEEALASDAEMSAEIRQLITSQKADLKAAHDQIKVYRDMQQPAHS
ncbi:MAG: PA2169 family four-helix-bundle protein [Chitinophagaceae bacterium]